MNEKRTKRRAEAKANRTCERPGCGKVFTPERSTGRFCPGGNCRKAAHQPKTNRLRAAQVRILEALAKRSHGYLFRQSIPRECRVNPHKLSDYLGKVGGEKPEGNRTKSGIISLLARGHVEEHVCDPFCDGSKIERYYLITEAGRKALEEMGRLQGRDEARAAGDVPFRVPKC